MSKSEVAIEINQGLPHLTVPLPSRNEPCIFVLKPVTHTIGDLLAMLKTEDPGIDRVVIRSIDGIRIASTTSIQTLMQSDFDLVINDVTYRVATPPFESSSGALALLGDDEMQRMGDVRALVGKLYEVCMLSQSDFQSLFLRDNALLFALQNEIKYTFLIDEMGTCISANFKIDVSFNCHTIP